MKTWTVRLPITGTLSVEVEAEDENSAIDKALNDTDYTEKDIDQWAAHRQIVRGNVFYGEQNEAEAEEVQ